MLVMPKLVLLFLVTRMKLMMTMMTMDIDSDMAIVQAMLMEPKPPPLR